MFCLIKVVCRGSFLGNDSLPFQMSFLEVVRIDVMGMFVRMVHIVVWRLMDQVAELWVAMHERVVVIDFVMTLQIGCL